MARVGEEHLMATTIGDPKLVAYCGLYCGACYQYRASFYDDDHLRAEAARRGRDPGQRAASSSATTASASSSPSLR